jgi:predicted metal-dependent hydrolase
VENYHVRIPRWRERRYGRAQKGLHEEWRFLTNYDLSSIKTEGQLRSMVKTRASISEVQAKRDVEAWMQGKQF